MVQEALGWEISRLRVSSKRFPSNTHTGASPPARDDDVGERPSRHFDRSEAEKSPPLMVRAALRWEISRLRVSSKRFPSNTHTGASPPLEMTILAGTPIVISTVAERSGEISRLNGQESGCGFRRGLFRRAVKGKVDGPPARGFLRFLSLTRLRREGGGGCFAADDKVSVTRLAFYVIGTAAQIL